MVMYDRLRLQGFTLVELLVVISIIAILSGLILGGYGSLERSRARAHTGMVLAITSTGLERRALELGGSVSGAPHPLSGVSDLADKAPHIAGFSSQARVLGVDGRGLRTRVQEGTVEELRNRNDGDVYHGDVWANAWAQAVQSSLGDTYDRLVELRAVRNPPRISLDHDPDRVWLIEDEDGDHRLRYYGGSDGPGSGSSWAPGRVFENGEWLPYALPGPTIIDAWGTEVIMVLDNAGRTNLISAGPDGAFYTVPGEDPGAARDDNISLIGEGL